MPVESNLNESASQLRDEGQLYPVVRNLLRLPSLIDDGLDFASGRLGVGSRDRHREREKTGCRFHDWLACRRACVSNWRRRWPMIISSPGLKVIETICSLSSLLGVLPGVCLRASTSLGLSSVSTAIEGAPSSSCFAQSAVEFPQAFSP